MAQTLATKTARLGLSVAEVNATGQVTRVNTNQALLELMAGKIWIKDKDLSAPPTLVNGEGYIAAASPSGAWSSAAMGTLWFAINSAWVSVGPWVGLVVYVEDENVDYRYDGAAWAEDNSLGSVSGGQTAGTTQSQGQHPLTKTVNHFATVATTNDCCTLMDAVACRLCIITNEGANTLQIFPASGDKIGAGATNASVSLAAGKTVIFVARSTAAWIMIPGA